MTDPQAEATISALDAVDAAMKRPKTTIDLPAITLRDWFAGQALVGLNSRDSVATDCYELADAMLAARESKR